MKDKKQEMKSNYYINLEELNEGKGYYWEIWI
jgi:hypothetical protein